MRARYEPASTEAQTKAPPPVMLQAVALSRLWFSFKAPLSVKVNPEFMVNVAAAPVKVTDAAAASAVTVTLFPLCINTTSPATGALAPAAPAEVAAQVFIEFQSPTATE